MSDLARRTFETWNSGFTNATKWEDLEEHLQLQWYKMLKELDLNLKENESLKEIAEINSELIIARHNLKKYGNHLEYCIKRVPRASQVSELNYDHCDCGYDEALKG